MISVNDIYAADGGQGYIESRYPDAAKSFVEKSRKFKLRNESTASASVYKKDNIWYVTDFGDDGKRRNAIDVCMLEDQVEFKEAVNRVAAFYNLAGTNAGEIRADFDKWPARPDEAEGDVKFVYKEFEMYEYRTLFSLGAWEAMGPSDTDRMATAKLKCTYLHFKALASYTYTKDGVTMQYSSNERFPIFVIEEPLKDKKSWYKIYKPNDKKEHRFFSRGEKPKDFVHGLDQLVNYVAEQRGGQQQPAVLDEDGNASKKSAFDIDYKVETLIICTGGSDALNVYGLDYNNHVVWLNSESAEVSRTLMKKLKGLAHKIYNLPDIDDTGKREAHELAMEFIDVYTIRLPESLLMTKDARGNGYKDVRDFLKLKRKYDFDQLKKTALQYRFWDQEQKYKDDEPVFKFGKPVWSYNFNNVRAYNFLFWNGFARLKSEKDKEGYCFIKVDGHVVRRVETSEIRDFVNGFLEKRFFNEDLRNLVYRSPQLGDTSLANLPIIELDFKPYDAESQYLFFQKWNEYKKRYDGNVWRVSAGKIEEVKGAAGKYVWKEKVLERKIKIKENYFEFKKDADENWLVDIKGNEKGVLPMVMAFLIQTCRVHWRKELEERLGICSRLKTVAERKEYQERYMLTDEDAERIFNPKNQDNSEFTRAYLEDNKFNLAGPLLSAVEQDEQRLHFVNRCFVIGYLLHRYKNASKPWGVWVMDNKIADEMESHGGSGKSLLVKMFIYMNLNSVPLDGRNPRLTDNPHIFENVDLTTDLVAVDDCWDHFNFGYFYPSLTSDLSANPKNKKGYTIPYSESPKFIFSSNFGDRSTDPSSFRRKIYTVYSDYYHADNGTGDYAGSKTPDEEFGRNLFDDWKDADWEEFYNFMAQCLAFYLGCAEKVKPPMGNVQKRSLIAEMTEAFRSWADVYFNADGDKVNRWVRKDLAFEEYKRESGLKNHTSTAWKKKLVAYCKYMKYEFNPPSIGSNIHKVKIKDEYGNEKETSKECVYVMTNTAAAKANAAEQLNFGDGSVVNAF